MILKSRLKYSLSILIIKFWFKIFNTILDEKFTIVINFFQIHLLMLHNFLFERIYHSFFHKVFDISFYILNSKININFVINFLNSEMYMWWLNVMLKKMLLLNIKTSKNWEIMNIFDCIHINISIFFYYFIYRWNRNKKLFYRKVKFRD